MSLSKLLRRIQFESGKLFHRKDLYFLKRGVRVRAKTPKKPAKVTGTTRLGFIDYLDHCAGGKYSKSDLKRVVALEQNPAWSIGKLDILKLHAAGITGAGEGNEKIVVVILDTGGSPKHEDLQGVYLEDLCRDFTSPDNSGWARDVARHGTHCAGIVAAQPNDTGVLGVAPGVKIVLGKVLGDNGSGSFQGIIDALDWAKGPLRQELNKRGFKHIIVSMSLGSNETYEPMNLKVKELVEAGIFVCCAAGNSGKANPDPDDNSIDCPGNAAGICDSDCVAAVDEDLARAWFSSVGKENTIAAPGFDIMSSVPDGYALFSGTSMATPFVAGLVALLIHAAAKAGTVDKLSPKVIRGLIWPGTATDQGKAKEKPSRDPLYGFGVVCPIKAVEVVQKL